MSATRSAIHPWAELPADWRAAAAHDLKIAGAVRRAAETSLCDALRDWCRAHDPALRACERRYVRREIANCRKAYSNLNAAWRQMRAAHDTVSAIAAE